MAALARAFACDTARRGVAVPGGGADTRMFGVLFWATHRLKNERSRRRRSESSGTYTNPHPFSPHTGDKKGARRAGG